MLSLRSKQFALQTFSDGKFEAVCFIQQRLVCGQISVSKSLFHAVSHVWLIKLQTLGTNVSWTKANLTLMVWLFPLLQ